MPRWHVRSRKTLKSKALIPTLMKPTPKVEEKRDKHLATSRGKPPLHYINEQFLDDTNDKTSFLDIKVHGVTI